jgi:hypothetical protein
MGCTTAPTPLRAVRVIRAMCGSSQPILVEADDGNTHVVKLETTPRGCRSLISAFLAGRVLTALGIRTPPINFIHIESSLLSSCNIGQQRPHEGMIHLASQCPVHAEKYAIYDFLPKLLMSEVNNLDHFVGVLLLDMLFGKDGMRQAVFTRSKHVFPDDPSAKAGFTAFMIGNGGFLGGSKWQLPPLTSEIPHYPFWDLSTLFTSDAKQRWIKSLQRISPYLFMEVAEQIPGCWWKRGDREQFRELVTAISERQAKLPETLLEAPSSVRADRRRRMPSGTKQSNRRYEQISAA